jgi:hypothetical protein
MTAPRSTRPTYKPELPADLLPPLHKELERCRRDPARFNSTILCRGSYWSKQREICESVVKYPITCVKTGNGVGKSFVDAGILLWFAVMHPGSKSVVAAPTQQQLSNVLWAEVRDAYNLAERNGMPLGGKMAGLTLEFGPNWRVEGFGSGSVESKSGRHSADLFALVDEASGVSSQVHEAVDSLNPSRRLYTANPISNSGKFYDLCQMAGTNPNVNVIEISSLESPHAHLDRSPFGMADKGFIDGARYEYGEDSLWWRVHILGQFPDEASQALLPRAWIERASKQEHRPYGDVWLSVDVAKGNDGDAAGILARDRRGVLAYEESTRWNLEHLAKETAKWKHRYEVSPARIVYDSAGLGVDFANRLAAMNIVGVKDYMGNREGSEKFFNLRSEAGWMVRRRLDPDRGLYVDRDNRREFVQQPSFSIPRHLATRFRPELEGVRYDLDDAGRIQVEPKDAFVARLKKSPTFLDCLFMSFAYPDV